MLVIVGASASGKSTVQDILCENYGFAKLITYTSRPIRPGEHDGVDYHFRSREEMEKMAEEGKFLEVNEYNGWLYGSIVENPVFKSCLVITPSGLRALKRKVRRGVVTAYIDVDRRSRLIQLLKRDADIEESYRRSVSDIGMFDGVEHEVDLHINNKEYKFTPDMVATQIYNGYLDKINKDYTDSYFLEVKP